MFDKKWLNCFRNINFWVKNDLKEKMITPDQVTAFCGYWRYIGVCDHYTPLGQIRLSFDWWKGWPMSEPSNKTLERLCFGKVLRALNVKYITCFLTISFSSPTQILTIPTYSVTQCAVPQVTKLYFIFFPNFYYSLKNVKKIGLIFCWHNFLWYHNHEFHTVLYFW